MGIHVSNRYVIAHIFRHQYSTIKRSTIQRDDPNHAEILENLEEDNSSIDKSSNQQQNVYTYWTKRP